MIQGHGDDMYKYGETKSNFSSNIFNHFDHSSLFEYLSTRLPMVKSYPEPEPYTLEGNLAERLNISKECVMATNGATEAIYLMAQCYANAHSYILQPTFSEYADACLMHHHTVVGLHSIDSFSSKIDNCDDGKSKLLWICNPNNPTGSVINREKLKGFIQQNTDTLFVIDESYAAYTQENVLQATEAVKSGNVILLRSMTKDFGIPGIRLGYAVAAANIINGIRKQRMPWSVNQIAIDAGIYLLKHSELYHIPTAMLCRERERVATALRCTGIEVAPSDTNILLAALPHGSAAGMKIWLIENYGILIRDASNFKGLTRRHFRIAVQGKDENDQLINAIREWITL